LKAIRHLIVLGLLLSFFSVKAQQKDSLRFPISDRRGDPLSNQSNNPFDLQDSKLIKRNIEYDPKTRQYYITEKIGNHYYRTPTYLTFEEFWRLESQKAEADYFKKRAAALTALNLKTGRPKMRVYDKLFDRIFGTSANGLKVDIRPSGEVNIMAGYQGQNIENPTLPERARKNGGFDFNMDAKLNVNANIGDKLKFPINYNTLSNLGFDNQLKLDYKGMDDELIKSIEAGKITGWRINPELYQETG
jgi:cell surface protein SprA